MIKYRRCDHLHPARVWFALGVLGEFWHRRARPLIYELRDPPYCYYVDRRDCLAALRLVALQTACHPTRRPGGDRLRALLWRELAFALRHELRRSFWWLDKPALRRLHVALRAHRSLPRDLLLPRPLHEVTELDSGWVAHLADDVPDRDALPLDEHVRQRLRARQVHALLARLPRECRGPTWRVHALGEDVYTASRALGITMGQCLDRSTEGLARLRGAVERGRQLLPPG